MKKVFLLIIGVILIAAGIYGVIYSVKATKAQVLYTLSRYSDKADSMSPEEIYSNYKAAMKLYPYNFYFSAYAGEKFFYNFSNYSEDELKDIVENVKSIAEDGIKINPYNSQLVYLHMRMLERTSVAKALEYWKKYVDWVFWNDYNHSVLAELYAKNGMYDKAFDQLKFLERSKYLEHTRHVIDDAWILEMKKKKPNL